MFSRMRCAWLVLPYLGLCAGLYTTTFAEPLELAIGFDQPKPRAVAIGETKIEMYVRPPAGTGVDRVEISVDGRPLTVLTAPPWETTWDAGDGSRAQRIVAVLHLTDGRTATKAVSTRRLVINDYESVDLVNLYVVVRDAGGRYVTDLTRDDFRIFERGSPQRIQRFSTTHKPLRVGLVLDNSLTMARGAKLEKAKAAALDFLDILQPGDEGLVANFSDTVEIDQDLTGDKNLLAAAIRGAEPKRGTALYDAIWRTSKRLAGFQGRRVLVLLSDGRDESYDGMSAGSLHTLGEAVEEALRNEVMVFAIGLGSKLDREFAIRWGDLDGASNFDTGKSLESILVELSESTGGRAVITGSAGKLRKAFGQFAEHLRHQYSIAYTSSDSARDGKWRRIEVEVPGRDIEVVTRKGYYAPSSRESRAR